MKVLVIEDDELDFIRIERLLSLSISGAELECDWMRVTNPLDLAQKIKEYDICFIDYHLGHYCGIELIAGLGAREVSTPIVLITGNENPELYKLAIAAGAADFLHKDEMSSASVGQLAMNCLARRHHEKELYEMAYTDQLTKLSNRAAFEKSCDFLATCSVDSPQIYALVLVDLDNFKDINDANGHPFGDEVLRGFSSHLSSNFGKAVDVARLGGDEFGLLIDLKGNEEKVHEMRSRLRSKMRYRFPGATSKIDVSASIGICMFSPGNERLGINEIQRRADKSLYLDKQMRQSAYSWESSRIAKCGNDLWQIIDDLRNAIDRNELEILYQPKVNCRTKAITGFEGLIRWNSSKHDLGPEDLISISEEHGLIEEIGFWVVRKCCEDLKKWRNMGHLPLPIAVNISPRQLEDQRFSRSINRIMRDYSIGPDLIQFELTEGAFNRNFEPCLKQMKNTAKLGYTWAIDDFGVGYSSLSRLNMLPVSKIKIDKSFMVQLPESGSALNVSNAIISLARKLGMTVVAEGVEHPDQIANLELGANDELQGFFFYKPMSFASATNLLKEPVAV